MSARFVIIGLIQSSLLAGCVTTMDKSPGAGRVLLPNQYEVFGQVYEIMPSNLGYLEIGIASWYGTKFHGRHTAMGEIYDMYALTAAHKALPLPTMVKVTNLDNGQSIVVRVNDRGPFHDDRLIDLSWGAARALGFDDKGIAPVVVEALDDINHPELAIQPHQDTYYLQVGAFRERAGAARQLTAVRHALPADVPSRILTSETDTALLYKVWVGPMTSPEQEAQIAARISAGNLGNPLRVKVE